MYDSVMRFNGQRTDPVSTAVPLGKGYRMYHPALMRFNRPDSYSPFGPGGINPYVFCGNDPVNHSDPSGHLGINGTSAVIAGILGFILMPFTLGQSLTVTTCLLAALETVSNLTAITSGLTEKHRPAVSSALSWVSLSTGLLAAGASLIKGVVNSLIQKGDYETWAVENFRLLGRADENQGQQVEMSFLFDDRISEGLRLNIVGHGFSVPNPAGSSRISRFSLGGRLLTGDELYDELNNVPVVWNRYSRIRVISCNSAQGKMYSVASQLMKKTGISTTGFRGNVTTRGWNDIVNTAGDAIISLYETGHMEKIAACLGHYDLSAQSVDVMRTNPYNFIDDTENCINFSYDPVTYHRNDEISFSE